MIDAGTGCVRGNGCLLESDCLVVKQMVAVFGDGLVLEVASTDHVVHAVGVDLLIQYDVAWFLNVNVAMLKCLYVVVGGSAALGCRMGR